MSAYRPLAASCLVSFLVMADVALSNVAPRPSPAVAGAVAAALQADLPPSYRPVTADSGYELRNPRHGMCFAFSGAGMTVASTRTGRQWGLTLQRAGRAGALRRVNPSTPALTGTRIEYERGPALTEWYLNTAWGVEQGFTLHTRPDGDAAASVALELALSGDLMPRLDAPDAMVLTDPAGAAVARYSGLYVFDAEGRELAAHLELTGTETLRILVDDRGATYPITVDPWIEEAILTADDGAADDWFGMDVAVDGDTVVVGAPGHNTDGVANRGAAYVFVRLSGGWEQVAKLTASDREEEDRFGEAVAIHGDTIAVGAPGNDIGPDADQGAVYVFAKPGGGWANAEEDAILTDASGDSHFALGGSVAIHGDDIVAGARGQDVGANDRQGAACVFTKPGGGWANTDTPTATLTAADGAFDDGFGAGVAISADTIVAGVPDADLTGNSQGAAYVFVKPPGGWADAEHNAKLSASDGALNEFFGTANAVDGDTVVVGAVWHGANVKRYGAAYVFVKPPGGWAGSLQQNAKLAAASPIANAGLGGSVAVQGDTVLAGAYGVAAGEGYGGVVHVYEKPNPGGWAGVLTETDRFAPGGNSADDKFGVALGVSGNTLVVGAHHNRIGINDRQGSAYIYTLAAVGPDMDVRGNGISIADGDLIPGMADHTDFGDVAVGGSQVRTFTIANAGDHTLILADFPEVRVTGAHAADFIVTNQPAVYRLGPGQETTFQVQHSPSQPGPRSAEISILCNDRGENPYNFGVGSNGPEINVRGNGVDIVSGDTTPSAGDGTEFGRLAVDGETEVHTFTIQNTRDSTLILYEAMPSPVHVTGTHAADFAVIVSPPAEIAGHSSPTFQVRFDPSGIGLRTATLSIPNTDTDEDPYVFGIHGTGAAGGVEINVQCNGVTIADGDTTPSPTDFTDLGPAAVTGVNVQQTVTIQNLGTAELALTGTPLVQFTGPHAGEFSIARDPTPTVPPGGHTTFVLAFDPTATGTRSATLSIPNNDGDENPYNFAVQGTGVSGTAWFVDGAVGSSGDGTTWGTAFQTVFEGIASASDGDVVLVKYGTYNITDDLVITGKDVRLTSDDGDGSHWHDAQPDRDQCTIDANDNCRIFTLTGATVTADTIIRGFTMREGDAGAEPTHVNNGGGILCADGASPVIEENRITVCEAGSWSGIGGGIACVAGGSALIRNNRIDGNFAGNTQSYGHGGGIGAHSVNPVIEGNTIEGNTGTIGALNGHGGGISAQFGTVTIRHNTIRNNVAGSGGDYNRGGGIWVDYGTTSIITGNLITGNQARTGDYGAGGGIFVWDPASTTITNNVIHNNRAGADTGSGGGLYVGAPGERSITVANNTFHGNVAGDTVSGWTEGAGFYFSVDAGGYSIRNNVFTGHASGGDPTALRSLYNVTVDYNCFHSNTTNHAAIGGRTVTSNNELLADPMYADAAVGDFHPKSTAGRWDPIGSIWAMDLVSSPCIDAGDPGDAVAAEPSPHGARINLGAFGGTVEASKSAPGIPHVTTVGVRDISATSGRIDGDVTYDGGATVTERGVCWNTSGDPIVADSHLAAGAGPGTFSVQPTSLTQGTLYYVRAYATNSQGTAYGQERSFRTRYLAPGSMVVFDGNDDGVTVPDHPDLDIVEEISLEAWIRPTAFDDWDRIVSREWATDADPWIIYSLNLSNENDGAEKVCLDLSIGGDNRTVWSTDEVLPNTWTHVAGTYDGSEMRIYVNGRLSGTLATSGDIDTNDQPLTIGRNEHHTYGTIHGALDEVRVWNVARSQQQIRENMCLTLPGGETGLVAYYQFNEGNGTAASDGARGHTGSLINGPAWQAATEPVGGGVSASATIAGPGQVVFGATGATFNFTAKTGTDDFVVTRIDYPPSGTPGPNTFNGHYWVINRFGSGTFTGDLSLAGAGDLTTADQASPGQIRLFARGSTADGPWTSRAQAGTVNATTDTATFPGQQMLSQLVMRRAVPSAERGNAVAFDGNNDYVDCGESTDLQGMTTLTLEAWVKPDANDVHRVIASRLGEAGSGGYQLVTGGPNSQTRFGVMFRDTTGVDRYLEGVTEFSPDTWYHVAGVIELNGNDTTSRIYVNGALDNSVVFGGRQVGSQNIGPFYIGSNIDGAPPGGAADTREWDGLIDELRVWRTARSVEQIRDTMHRAANGHESGLVAYWQLNESAGTVASDVIGANPGTLVNMDVPSVWTAAAQPWAHPLVATSLRGVWDALTASHASDRLTLQNAALGPADSAVFGHDSSADNWQANDCPATIAHRLTRRWQTTRTGGVTADVRIDTTGLSGVGDGARLRLLVDADGTFVNGATIVGGTFNDPFFTVAAHAVEHAHYYTLGILAEANPPQLVLTSQRVAAVAGTPTTTLMKDLFQVTDPDGPDPADAAVWIELLSQPQNGTLLDGNGDPLQPGGEVLLADFPITYQSNDPNQFATEWLSFRAWGNGWVSGVVQLEVVVGAVLQGLLLEAGWNLVSFKMDPLDTDPAVLFTNGGQPIIAGPVFYWDAQLHVYVQEQTLIGGRGYWIYVINGPVALTDVAGSPVNSLQIAVVADWNLLGPVGPGDQRPLPNAPGLVRLPAWGWNAQRQASQAAAGLFAGYGYWFFCFTPGNLDLGMQ